MTRSVFAVLALVVASACAAPPPPPPPAAPPSTAVTASLKTPYEAVKAYVTRAIEQTPEARLAYQPTKEVRTLGQLFGHIADSSYMFCNVASGESVPSGSLEQTLKTKAELQKAVADAFAYCDRAWGVDDTTGAVEATIVPINNMKTTKLGALAFNTAHLYEHYGNIVTYFRLNKMVPPSSQPAAGM
jgi:uncharacterized damage-inducible protein DinB